MDRENQITKLGEMIVESEMRFERMSEASNERLAKIEKLMLAHIESNDKLVESILTLTNTYTGQIDKLSACRDKTIETMSEVVRNNTELTSQIGDKGRIIETLRRQISDKDSQLIETLKNIVMSRHDTSVNVTRQQ
ncbi:MAG: hypothetical protein MJZ30_05945 [Paludibacteraceae bacterium]|nr:hypothetical protein [Paludibacteraceae bacterium]